MTTKPLPNKPPNKTRSRILDAALTLMMQEGFHGVTVERIISLASISKGSFFYHFASKDALPQALLERFIQQQGEVIQEAMAHVQAIESPLDRVLALIDGVKPVFAIHCGAEPGCMMAAFSYQLMQEFPEVERISQAAFEGWRKGFTPFFETLCNEAPSQQHAPGIVSANASPTAEELSMQLMIVLQGANVVARIEKNSHYIDLGVNHFKQYLQQRFSSALM